ncbi:maleylpyruvate isomerase family mycothiol-dependent enzyme [Kineosporia sp. J2-2]|uniref:Maleylpyruvate isomerase family mycothiol-dependent enzyme n=1 Tax=Kineosporia corallincola TaxID=2835133 RepID=A0ABS5TMS1_9ACTN|nr:maleylpyruvate isomerase family mycothiol-dependent enzyme [Kineosporia corallincola]MBT0770889.1 maleylpyruvate isomerase family mycothiol-dependent enzyme [Kineosporia corallincola]
MPEERPVVTALTDVYTALADLVSSLPEADGWHATPLPGWSVRDLLVHLLGDAERALVALGTPAAGPADRDAVSYWADFAPAASTPESVRRRDRQIRVVRALAVAHPWEVLTRTYAETTAAVCVLAGRTAPDELISTQGHTLTTDDLLGTLVVEATVHHLDLASGLGRPGPPASGLAVVHHCLDGLLGRPEPVGWDDVTYALTGTGRRPLTTVETTELGDDASRFPLFA